MRLLGQFQAFLFFIFLQKDFTRTKSTITHISKQRQKRQHFYALKTSKEKKVACSPICVFVLFMLFCVKNKEDSIFMRIKTSKRKKAACLTLCSFHAFCAFYAFYGRIKRLGESRFFVFCAFCAFYAFCAYKKHLSESYLFAFCIFCAFCACEIFSWKKNKSALIPSFTLLLRSTWIFS